jgi:hypothetical protein
MVAEAVICSVLPSECGRPTANWSPRRPEPEMSRCELAPLGQRDRAFRLKMARRLRWRS